MKDPVEKVADQALISKWRKPGYENLCSLLAVQKGDTNFGTASICRVPIASRCGVVRRRARSTLDPVARKKEPALVFITTKKVKKKKKHTVNAVKACGFRGEYIYICH